MKKEKIIFYTLWGVSFGLVCACSFAGIYSKITQGIVLITWTFNGFLLGRSFQQEKANEDIDMLITFIKEQQEVITDLDEKYHITNRFTEDNKKGL